MVSEETERNLRRRRAMSMALWTPVIYFAAGMVPLAYEFSTVIPKELTESHGTLSLKRVGREVLTRVSNREGEQLFTCASGFRGYSECLPHKNIPDLINNEARVLWYEQAILPAMTVKKLVVLYVNGRLIISREMSEKRMNRSRNTGLWVFLSIEILILPISIFFLRKARSI